MIHPDYEASLAAQEAIAQRFGQRFLVHLSRMRAWFQGVGFEVTEPFDDNSFDTQWRYTMDLGMEEHELTMGISFLIIRGCHVDLDPFDDGVNLGLEVIQDGGFVPVDLQPRNFTPDVWVDCSNWLELEKRFRLITSNDAHEMVHEAVLGAFNLEFT